MPPASDDPTALSPDALAALVDHNAIERLVPRYADVITRRALQAMPALFVADMPLQLDLVTSPLREMTGAVEIGNFIDGAVQRFSFFEFVPLNLHVELYPNGDRRTATARLWMCEIRCGADGHDGAGNWSTAYGLYDDTFCKVQERWWFARRSYRSLARTGDGAVVLPFPELG